MAPEFNGIGVIGRPVCFYDLSLKELAATPEHLNADERVDRLTRPTLFSLRPKSSELG